MQNIRITNTNGATIAAGDVPTFEICVNSQKFTFTADDSFQPASDEALAALEGAGITYEIENDEARGEAAASSGGAAESGGDAAPLPSDEEAGDNDGSSDGSSDEAGQGDEETDAARVAAINLLDGTIAEIEAALPTVDPVHLPAMIAAETAGKNRVGVLNLLNSQQAE